MKEAGFTVRLPEHVAGLSQVEEYVILVQDGNERRIRLHDYDQIYSIPGLYEHIINDMLKCESPQVIAMLLADQLSREQSNIADLVVLEVGAGTGLVGLELSRKGVRSIIGIDIVPEARVATYQRHPNVYQSYYIEDLCNPSAQSRRELESAGFTCLVCASALGLNHIPPAVFAAGFNLIEQNGWVVFNVNENYLQDKTAGGFPQFIARTIDEGRLEIHVSHTYRHRLAIDGSPITYVAMVGRKRANIPADSL